MKKYVLLLPMAIILFACTTTTNNETRPNGSSESWSLFLYESSTPDYNPKRIDGYTSLTQCQEKGYSKMVKGGSFECGKNPHDDGDGWGEIFETICNSDGVCE